MDNQPYYLTLLCILLFIGGCDCKMRSGYWEKDPTSLWYNITGDVIYTKTDSSRPVVHCTSTCLDNKQCLMCSYNRITGTCRGFRFLKYSPLPSPVGSEVIYKHRQRCRRAGYDLFEDGPLCVKNHDNHLTWDDAQAQCENDHGRIVVIDNKKKLQAFYKYAGSTLTERVWVGINDKKKEGSWVWLNGARLDLSYWPHHKLNDISREYKKNEHSADCGSTWNWELLDNHCLLPHPYVCERTDLL